MHRTGGGIRDYQEDDLGWVELAICMRSAGLPVEVMIEYVRLYMQGDSTIPDRLQLLLDQKVALEAQMADTQRMLDKLEYKISRYQVAVKPASSPGINKRRKRKMYLERSTALPM